MFARVKKSGKYQYLQIVENRKVSGKVKQRVVATVGRLDQLQAKGRVETLIRSLSRYSEKVLLILSGKSDPNASMSCRAYRRHRLSLLRSYAPRWPHNKRILVGAWQII